MVVTDRGLAIGHIGLRAYAWQATPSLSPATTPTCKAVDSGIITVDEARRHPQRSLVTRGHQRIADRPDLPPWPHSWATAFCCAATG